MMIRSLIISSLLASTAIAADREIPIGNIRPEGIHLLSEADADSLSLDTATNWALVGELLFGGVRLLDLGSGETTTLVPSSPAESLRSAIGVNFANGMVLAAGGTDHALHAYDGSTGELLTSCMAETGAGFVNDIEVVDGTVYATDSFINRLYFVELSTLMSGGDCTLQSYETPVDIFPDQPGVFEANGLVFFAGGMFIVSSTSGSLHHLPLDNATVAEPLEAIEVIPPGESLMGGDGLELFTDDAGDSYLYITVNAQNKVSVFKATANMDGVVSVEAAGELTSDLYDTPATSAVGQDFVWSANARFGLGLPAEGEFDLTTFNETFSIVEVKRVAEAASPTSSPATETGEPTMAPGETSDTRFVFSALVTVCVTLMLVLVQSG